MMEGRCDWTWSWWTERCSGSFKETFWTGSARIRNVLSMANGPGTGRARPLGGLDGVYDQLVRRRCHAGARSGTLQIVSAPRKMNRPSGDSIELKCADERTTRMSGDDSCRLMTASSLLRRVVGRHSLAGPRPNVACSLYQSQYREAWSRLTVTQPSSPVLDVHKDSIVIGGRGRSGVGASGRVGA